MVISGVSFISGAHWSGPASFYRWLRKQKRSGCILFASMTEWFYDNSEPLAREKRA
jgi:hypothetical protein